jgi:hypothetical protein
MQGFVLRLPPQNKAQAKFMQPLQYVSQHPLANLHLSLRAWQHQMTTIMLPFQCDLQPQIFKKRIELRTQTQPPVAEHRGGTHRVRNDRSRIHRTHRYLSSPAATTLHGKMQGFVLRLPPQNKAHATFMRPLQDRSFYTRQLLDREALHREPLPEDLGDVAKWQFLHQLLRIEFHVVRKGSI